MKLIIKTTVICLILLSMSCKKDSGSKTINSDNLQIVSTNAVVNPLSSINATSVITGGTIINTELPNIMDKGIVWGTDSNALTFKTINKISNGSGNANFIDTIRNLQPSTNYYVKAYVVLNTGVSYGAAVKFSTLQTQPTVYTAGRIGISAVYWKNDSAIYLTNGSNIAWARSIYVVGNDVYAAGEEMTLSGSTYMAVYWKNGKKIRLTDSVNSFAIANSIFVSGNDVYVAGYEVPDKNYNAPIPKYWKNGVSVSLTNRNYVGIANSIFVSGNDVYVAGTVMSNVGYQYCAYWKNGNIVPLNDSVNAVGDANSIFVKNNDVYVGGSIISPRQAVGGIPKATIWKNGSAISLTDGTQDAKIWSVYVSDNNDVYGSGFEYDGSTGYSVAKYWKNGAAIALTDGKKYADANSIFVKGNDVYVGVDDWFEDRSNYFQAKIWKNVMPVSLFPTTQESRATAIFVQ